LHFIGLFLSSILKMHGPKNKIELTTLPAWVMLTFYLISTSCVWLPNLHLLLQLYHLWSSSLVAVSDLLNSTAGISWRKGISVSVGMYRCLPIYTCYISVGIYWYLSVSTKVAGWDPMKTIKTRIFASAGNRIPLSIVTILSKLLYLCHEWRMYLRNMIDLNI